MNFAAVFIQRPVLTVVASLFITLLGGISYFRLGVREFPAIDPPTITIITSYPGAAPEVIESQITEPLEEAINSVAGIYSLNSASREGSSQITAEFVLGTDLETAANDVRNQIARAVRNLPPDADPPLITKADADVNPIFGIIVSSPDRSELELGALADTIKERLQTVPGVASVERPVEKRYAMRLWLDPVQLAARGLTPLDVREALTRENIELPSGRIEGFAIELSVKALSRLSTVEEFNNMAVKQVGDRLVRIRDVGYAELGALNERSQLRGNNRPVAGLFFRPLPGANQVDIVDEMRRRLEQIEREVPSDVNLTVAFDNTEYVRRSIHEVQETVFVAFALVVVVVFGFFREWRTTLIPILAIPVSIIGVFFLMEMAGFSINVLTLLGVVLAIGLVVDDAIVVLENIHAKITKGMKPRRAAVEGTREIFMPVIATTITLAVVFLPLLFLGGLSGRLFREFGITLAGAVLISAFVALTLTPMLCARLLRCHQQHSWLHRVSEPFFAGLESTYARSLEWFLHRRWLSLATVAVACVLIVAQLRTLPRELAPLEDRSRLRVSVVATEGVTYEYTLAYMDELTRLAMEHIPEAEMVVTQVPGTGTNAGATQGQVNTAWMRIFLPAQGIRQRAQQDIAESLLKILRQQEGARVNVTQEPTIGQSRGSAGTSAQLVLQAPNFEALKEKLPVFLEEARKRPEFTFVDSNLKFNKPELKIHIHRDKALAMGVSAEEIARTLQGSLSGQRFGYFVKDGRQFEVVAQLTRNFRSQPQDLDHLYVRAAGGELVSLANLVSLTESSAPPELYRYNRYISATISATLARGSTLHEGTEALRSIAKSTLDERFSTSLTGASRDLVESSQSMGYIFALALVFIYLVLAAQFESFRDPFVILLTVPLALAGALLALAWCHQSLNIFSQIGLIMLIGLVTKNGILIVEFANNRRDLGLPPLTAALHASTARLRPILMTTAATILGILPIALSLGAGSESRASMGIAAVGGVAIGGFLTLFVIPATYVMLSRRTTRTIEESESDHEPLGVTGNTSLAPAQ
jgi:multidrug efflux pump